MSININPSYDVGIFGNEGAPKFNVDSTLEICKPSRQVAVYGFQHCGYTNVMRGLRESNLFQNVYSGFLSVSPPKDRTTIENRVIDSFCSGGKFKATLVDIVFENSQRKKLGLPLIPVLFCVDTYDNWHPWNPESVCDHSYYVTNSEMRRAYKLCCEFEDPAIRQVAGETFKFVKLAKHKTKPDTIELQEIDAPWKCTGWEAAWARRKTYTIPRPGKTSDWRADLRKKIHPPSLCERLTQKAKDAFTGLASKMKDLDMALFTQREKFQSS